jgi:hypothetical protein
VTSPHLRRRVNSRAVQQTYCEPHFYFNAVFVDSTDRNFASNALPHQPSARVNVTELEAMLNEQTDTVRERRCRMHNFFRLLSAGPMFFVSAWLLMLFAGIEHAHVGIHPFGYLTSMVLTIGLWLVVSPAIAAVARGRRQHPHP